MNQGFVEQDRATKRYGLGLVLFTLAAAGVEPRRPQPVSREALRQLSRETGDTAALCLRSGPTLVCMDVELGHFPIKALPMDIGSHRPLGAGSAGVALLAGLPDFEVEQALDRAAPRLAEVPGQDRGTVEVAVAQCRARGYALVDEPPPGRIVGLAVALVNRRGRPQGTLALHGIPERFQPERLPELVRLVTAQARAIDQAMWRLPDDERHRSRWLSAKAAEAG